MSALVAPALATALWAGLLVRPWVGEAVAAWVWLGAGTAMLGLALLSAPRPEGGSEVLALAGLVEAAPPDHGDAVRSELAVERPERSAAPAFALAVAAAFVLAIGWGSVHAHRVAGAVVAGLAGERVGLEGSLRVDPRAEFDRWSAILDVREVRWDGGAASVRESVWLSGHDEPPPAVRGDRMAVSGVVRFAQDGGFSTFLSRRGIAAEVEVAGAERVGPAAFAPIRWAQRVREIVERSILRSFPSREAGLLLGLAVGDDSRLDPALERDFRASGLSHLLVVSGGNVAMILAPVLLLGVALRLARWPRFALGAGTVAFFVVLTGAEPSVLRAGVMAGLALVGLLLGRPRSSGSILSAAVAGLLVLDPALVWSVGFQLSVAATAGMIAMATAIADRVRFVPRPLAVALGATLAAQIGVTPVLLFHFHEVPLSTVIANTLAFPAVAPSMLLGLAAVGVGLVFKPAGELLAWFALAPMRYLETVADRMARAPVPWITGGGGTTLVLGLACAASLAWWLRSRRRAPRAVVLGLVALAPLVVVTNAISAGPPSELTVRFFDVGQGDAALLTSPGGAAILVDGGPEPGDVATELAALGVKRLDVVIASHPHADHVIGVPAILARFPVGLLLEPGCPTDSPDAETLAEAVAAEGVPVRHPRAGAVLIVGDVRLEVLSPDRCWAGTESDANNDAIVVRASLGEDSVLFATEPEEPAQELLLEEDVDLRADVLKVPHHGAATSVPEFFDAVEAQVAVVSVGPNTYGHPVPEVLAWIRDAGSRVVRTDLAGTVTITFSERGLLVESAA